jgi:S-adenosyl-L-methionine hydrolase (adenosine-forming)
MFTPNSILTLTTDFGIDDAYVAIMKGVILNIAPHTRIVDYTHGIKPGNVVEAAYLLRSGYRYFPRGTVHVVVVDPGVGSSRRAVAIQTPDATFIGPDNGVFSLVAEDAQRDWPGDCRMIELTEGRWWLPNVSATFHGRDIFSPVAAHLINGMAFEAFGRPVADLLPANRTTPQSLGNGVLMGRIVHIDRFGNCITNITHEHLHEYDLGERLVIEIIDQHLGGLFRTYSDGPTGTPMCLIGSSGHLELAVRNGNAAQYLGVDIGDKFKVRRSDDRKG